MPESPLLSVRDLHVSYLTGRKNELSPAVHGVSLEVSPGELVAVVGESGSGKSTTAHAILGLLDERARITSGQITFDGTDLVGLSARRWRSLRGLRIGYVPQDPTTSLNPTRRIRDQIAESLLLHDKGLSREAVDLKVMALLDKVGLDRPDLRARQYPHELSGGMRQRVLIASALANDPDLIIADEPTSALDVTIQKQILDHLDTLRTDLGVALLLITHDLGVASDRADRVVVLSEGEVVESGTADVVINAPRHAYTSRLVAAIPDIARGRILWDAPRPVRADTDATPVMQATGLFKTFAGGRSGDVQAVSDVSVSVARGQTLGIVGESGSGKSTLARLIMRLVPADAGTVTFAGRDITHLSGAELRPLRRHMQLIYQNPFASLDPRFTVERTLAEPLRAFSVGSRSSRSARVAELLDLVGLPASLGARRPSALSGGQRQRVAIARALATNPDLLVLDEAVSALDVSVQSQILELLARLQAELDLTMVFISHDLAVVRQISDQICVMKDGSVVEQGPADNVFHSPRSGYTRALLAAVPGQARRSATRVAVPT